MPSLLREKPACFLDVMLLDFQGGRSACSRQRVSGRRTYPFTKRYSEVDHDKSRGVGVVALYVATYQYTTEGGRSSNSRAEVCSLFDSVDATCARGHHN